MAGDPSAARPSRTAAGSSLGLAVAALLGGGARGRAAHRRADGRAPRARAARAVVTLSALAAWSTGPAAARGVPPAAPSAPDAADSRPRAAAWASATRSPPSSSQAQAPRGDAGDGRAPGRRRLRRRPPRDRAPSAWSTSRASGSRPPPPPRTRAPRPRRGGWSATRSRSTTSARSCAPRSRPTAQGRRGRGPHGPSIAHRAPRRRQPSVAAPRRWSAAARWSGMVQMDDRRPRRDAAGASAGCRSSPPGWRRRRPAAPLAVSSASAAGCWPRRRPWCCWSDLGGLRPLLARSVLEGERRASRPGGGRPRSRRGSEGRSAARRAGIHGGPPLDPTLWDVDLYRQPAGLLDRRGRVRRGELSQLRRGRRRRSHPRRSPPSACSRWSCSLFVGLGGAHRTGAALVEYRVAYAYITAGDDRHAGAGLLPLLLRHRPVVHQRQHLQHQQAGHRDLGRPPELHRHPQRLHVVHADGGRAGLELPEFLLHAVLHHRLDGHQRGDRRHAWGCSWR